MRIRRLPARLITLILPGILLISARAPAAAQRDPDLVGVWEAKRRFGPDVKGTLLVEQVAGRWRAEIAGQGVEPQVTDSSVAFALPGDRGAFRGRFAAGRSRIVGHWIQPRTVNSGAPYASPVELVRSGTLWRGEVVPLADDVTFYLVVRERADGSLGAFLRNPERNLGRQLRVDHVERTGEAVRLMGARGSPREQALAAGTLRDGVLSLGFPSRGGSYDFHRLAADEVSDFYPRGRPDAGYVYLPPPALGDGWSTGTLEEVGISRDSIVRWMRAIIATADDSLTTPRIHAILIARHGKLVLEEYFHGESRERPHDTRSAAKSLTATLVGAAIHAGVPLRAESPVYRVMNGGAFPAGLEPRKRALTLEHLLTMGSGLDCDDADPKSPGGEETMLDQEEQPDYYRFTLDLGMARDPGARSVYCSVQPNLAGGVLSRAAGRPLPELMRDLVAEPLQISRYWMMLTPTGDAYMGGGVRFLPRDFMKLGELYLREGRWNGRQVLSAEWVRRATSPLVALGDIRYGYLWWVIEYPWRGRTLRGYFAAGNGGQMVMAVPELDLVVATYGGSYADGRATIGIQRSAVPHILPAIQ